MTLTGETNRAPIARHIRRMLNSRKALGPPPRFGHGLWAGNCRRPPTVRSTLQSDRRQRIGDLFKDSGHLPLNRVVPAGFGNHTRPGARRAQTPLNREQPLGIQGSGMIRIPFGAGAGWAHTDPPDRHGWLKWHAGAAAAPVRNPESSMPSDPCDLPGTEPRGAASLAVMPNPDPAANFHRNGPDRASGPQWVSVRSVSFARHAQTPNPDGPSGVSSPAWHCPRPLHPFRMRAGCSARRAA